YATPIMAGRQCNSPAAQKLEIAACWTMCIAMLAITLLLTLAGYMQVSMQRLPQSELAMSFMATQDEIAKVYWARLVAGV
ncbi:nitric-oxide reductase large subunit, partial [Salmonella enterica subsp. enterica serovar Typhimurium]|nr:nitric-oxide reductase large subunit [Salmonella enterica subsp. enterica serovar Typhimurium]